MLTNARSTDPAESEPAFEAYDLRCLTCSWKQQHIVTVEYARTLKIQHEFRYNQHVVEMSNG